MSNLNTCLCFVNQFTGILWKIHSLVPWGAILSRVLNYLSLFVSAIRDGYVRHLQFLVALFYPNEKSMDDLIEDKDVFDDLITDLEPLIQATEEVLLPPKALLPFSQIHQRGRPPKFALSSLAFGLAQAFRKHLAVKPTKTRGGKFEQCLRIAAQAFD